MSQIVDPQKCDVLFERCPDNFFRPKSALIIFLSLINLVQCPRGSFHDEIENSCTLCPLGSFNSLNGQTNCTRCPDFYSTRKNGSRLSTDCRQLCPPGHFARIKIPKKSGTVGVLKTLMPFCRSCEVGEYQSEYDQLSCNKCPENMKSERASKSIESCYEKQEKSCNESTCRENGKCISTGAFYNCECKNGFYGQRCELKQDLCFITPCFNGAFCNVFNDSTVVCECPPNFIGEFCEYVNDPCSVKNCTNGANCNEIEDQAVCDCLPGFDGETCERQIPRDFCESSPCLGGAACTNFVDDYECKVSLRLFKIVVDTENSLAVSFRSNWKKMPFNCL